MDNLSCRVLLVEDSEDDFLIVRDLLADITTTKFDLQWVDNYQAARELLANSQYDVCLLDYRLGEGTGLELVREFAEGGAPFILLTGNEDHEVDVAATKAGAADYLLKGHINAPLVERSIRYAIERKRAAQTLRESEVRYRRLFESAHDGILILDAHTRKITDVNPYMMELLEYSRAEFVGKEVWEIGLLEDAEASARAFRELQQNGFIRYDDLPLETKGGERREVEFVSNLYGQNGHTVVQCNIRDNTERKRAERESQRFLQATLDALSSHIAVVDENGDIVAVNKAWQRFADENGGGAACGVGANYLKACLKAQGRWADEGLAVAEGIRNVMEARQAEFCLEYPCHSASEQRWFTIRATRFAGDGPARVAVAHENVSERKAIEESLHQERDFITAVVDTVGSLVIVLDAEGRIIRFNRACEQLTGYSCEEVENREFWEILLATEEVEAVKAGYQELRSGQFPNRYENFWVAKSGEKRLIAWSNTALTNAHGAVEYIIGTGTDITESRQAEQALRKGEQEQRELAERLEIERAQLAEAQKVAKLGSWELDLTTNALTWSDENYRVFDIERGAFANTYEAFLTRIHPDDREAVNTAYWESVANHTPYAIDHRIVMGDGSLKIVHERCRTFYDELDRPIRSVGTTQDITERKDAEQALLASEEKFRQMAENTNEVFWMSDPETKQLLYISPAYEKIWGRTCRELYEQPALFTEAIHPEERADFVMSFDDEVFPHGTEKEYRIVRPDGEVRWIWDRAFPVRNEEGVIYRTVGIAQDITERKRATEATARLAAIVESSSDAILSCTEDGTITSWNIGAESLYGYAPEEVIGRSISILAPPDFTNGPLQTLAAIKRGKRVTDYETIRVCKDGHSLDVSLTLSPIKNEAGELIGASAITRDISDRMRAENALRSSEARFQAFMNNSPAIAFILDDQSRFVYVNETFEKQVGITLSSGQPVSVFDVWPADIAQTMHEQNQSVLALNHFVPVTEALPGKDGEIRYWTTRKFLLTDAGQNLVAGLGVDVTDEHRNALALRESEERFQSMVANTPGTVYQFVCRPDGAVEIPFVSEGCREIFEMAPEDLRQNPTFPVEVIHPDDRADEEYSVRQSIKTLEPWSHEWRIQLPSGKTKWLQGASRPQRLPDGGTLWDGLVMDITARKEAEVERDRFFTISLDMLGVFGLDGNFKRMNPAYLETLGFSEAELIGQPFLDWVHPDDRAATIRAVEELVLGTPVIGVENRYRRKDGSYRWLEWKAVSDIGQGVVYAAARDVTQRREAQTALYKANDELELRVLERTAELMETHVQLQEELGERKRTEDSLRAAQQMLQLVMNHIPQAIFWKDRNCIYMGCNNRMAADAGLDSPDQIAGKSDFDLPWADLADAYRTDDAWVMRTDIPKLNIEEPLRRADGAQIWLRTNKVPLHDAHGAVVGVLASYEDITLQKEAEAAIHMAREEAEAANLAKSEFLSRMSHELRTPLNAILGFGQILEMRASDAKQRENIDQILKAGRHLLALINEVLDISRIEAGHLSLSLEPIPVGIVVREALDLVRPLTTARNIELVNAVLAGDAAKHLLADQQRLKQVLLNLLSNAVKYNREEGSVFVYCEISPGAAADGEAVQTQDRLRFLVRDTGAGLTPDDISKLFMPFERLQAARTQIEGTGIGLTLCKRLVEAMHGTIGVESTPGVGSTFWVELPLAISPIELAAHLSEAEDSPPASSPQMLGTVLYIEDNLSNINLIEHALSDRNYQLKLITALQGSVGLELAARHAPDLILLDVHLPDIMGDVVLRHLKADAATRDIPVVVLSADATPSQVERLMSGGAETYLTKPLDLKLFFEVLERFLTKVNQ